MHVCESELRVLACVPLDVGLEILQRYETGRVDASDHAEVHDNHVDRRRLVGDACAPAQLLGPTLASRAPVALGADDLEGDVGPGRIGLDAVEALVGDGEGIEEDEWLVGLEDLGIARQVGDVHTGEGVVVLERRDATDAREADMENVNNKLEAHGSANADFARLEESEPECEHGSHEVDKRSLPVVIEDLGRCEDRPNGSDNDGCESGLWDPEECRAKRKDGKDNNATGDECKNGALHAAGRVDGCARHGTTYWHR